MGPVKIFIKRRAGKISQILIIVLIKAGHPLYYNRIEVKTVMGFSRNMRTRPPAVLSWLSLCLAGLLLVSSCSLNKIAVRKTADALTAEGGSSAFASDEDPQLVADALPFALKMYETLLVQLPEHEGLLITSAEGFVSYAHAFILSPSNRLGFEEREKKKEMRERAKKMFLRGRGYALELLELRYPGFSAAAREGEMKEYLLQTDEEDLRPLYWAAAGWMGAISAAGLDLGMVMDIARPVALMSRAFELDPDYDEGAIHSFFIQIYGAVPSPAMLYGSGETGTYVKEVFETYYRQAPRGVFENLEDPETLARHHFTRAVELSKGTLAGPYVALAAAFPVKNQDADEYRRLLEKALAIDLEAAPEKRLVNRIDQETAAWMLESMGDIFITYTEHESE